MLPEYKGESWLNRQIGKYTIIGIGEKIKYKSQKQPIQLWKVKCECGIEKEISKYHLIYGNVEGCSDCLGDRVRFEECKNWNSSAKYVTGMYYQKIKKTAHKRNIVFDISREELDKLFQQQNKKCKYTNLDLIFETHRKKGNASLDRIDSNLGYIKNNLQWVHKDVNRMKWDIPHEDFIKICKLITENLNG